MPASFFIDIHRIDWISQILRRVFLALNRVVQHQIHGSSTSLGIIGSGFRHRVNLHWKVASCHLFDMALCFLVGSERKSLKWLQGELREIHNVEQTKKMIPLITCETLFGQHVSELVLGVNIFDLDLGVQIDSVEQPNQRNSVSSGYVSSSSDFVL